tara:strand:+ start:1249 stop:2400 length:1152 start_codon:yes stop_codon:yes gene_type:complete
MSDDEKSIAHQFVMEHDESWCRRMGYFNPYLDPFENHLEGDVPVYDSACFESYPDHNFVYDKLWVASSQGIEAGTLVDLYGLPESEQPSFPIFVKPRWGHKTSGSKHCLKVSNRNELPSLNDAAKNDLMWSGFIAGREGMTDFVLVDGRTVYQMTHVYSPEQHSFADVWKLTSPSNRPPAPVEAWVAQNMTGFTGIVNVQYRDETIIEVGLRPARTGAYFAATDNKALLRNISSVLATGEWEFVDDRALHYKPFYSFKCHTTAPIVYVWPQWILDGLMMTLTERPFYEYYPEPTGRKGMVFFQFMHDDLDEGRAACRLIEEAFYYTQQGILVLWGVVCIFLVFNLPGKWVVAACALLVYATQLLNPLSTHLRFHRARVAQANT